MTPSFQVILGGLFAGVLLSIVLLNFCIAYIIFTPDSMPKPFYLSCSYLGAASEETPGALAEPGGRKYIRANNVLEFEPPDLEYYELEGEEKQALVVSFEEDVNTKMPVIDDSIIALMSSKTFEDVYTAEGKEALRSEITNAVNSRLTDLHVIHIYYTEFVVQ